MAINSLSSMSNGLAGLASGMDTQSMVDAMLSGTQAKIDKQKASKTILGYKQSIYRDIYSNIKSFQESFLNFNSPTNLRYGSFYNTMNAASKASAFRVTATSGAAAGKTTVNAIRQLAKSSTYTSGGRVSGTVKGELALSNLKEDSAIQLNLDGVMKTIKLPKAADGAPALTEEQFIQQLDENIKAAFGNGVSAKREDPSDPNNKTIIFDTGSTPGDISRQFTITGDANSMSVLGMPTGISNKINDGMALKDINFGTELVGEKFRFSINGVEFEAHADESLRSVIGRINSSDANVKIRYSTLEDKFVAESTVPGKGATIEFSQKEGNLLGAMFGVNGSSGVGGKALTSYASTMEGKISGYAYDGNTPLTADQIQSISDSLGASETELNRIINGGGKLTVTVGGTEIDLGLTKRPDNADGTPGAAYTIDDVIDAMATKGITMTAEEDSNGQKTGKFTLDTPGGKKVELSAGIKASFGMSSSNETAATGSTTIGEAGLTGTTITVGNTQIAFTKNTTMDTLAQSIQNALPPGATVKFGGEGNEARFMISGVDSATPIEIKINGDGGRLFGTDTIQLGKTGNDTGVYVEGQNSKLVINGVEVERNSNEFTIDGMSYQLVTTFNEGLNMTNISDPERSKFEDIEVTRDTDKIFDGVSKFMDEYNKLVDKVWGLLKAEPTYKDYAPLTDKQKESMSDKEVELWEKKSQEGLMRSDKTLVSIMETMRRTLLAKPDGAKYSLAELGITTSYDMEKGYGGKLVFSDDAGTGEKLKEMIAQEPEQLEKLFAGTDGILDELWDVTKGVMTQTPKTSTGKTYKYSELSLTNLAGTPGLPDTSSTIYNQVRDINTNLESLNRKYKLEYQRYWKQFNSMEKLISQMNSQSSWLSQQFSA